VITNCTATYDNVIDNICVIFVVKTKVVLILVSNDIFLSKCSAISWCQFSEVSEGQHVAIVADKPTCVQW